MHRKNGFTLTELLIVVAILGILASLAIPRLFPQTERARASEAISILSAIRQGEEAYRLQQGVYLALSTATDTTSNNNWLQVGVENPNSIAGRFFDYSVPTISNGPPPSFTARANRRNVNPGSEYQGTTIQLDNTGTWSGDHAFKP